ncbi:uncharacterized protein LOC105767319 [Gossypium raimondii]|uniref:uncharacterized protein LOC105767319 n=1 Tax=Gossypium raimondii TaxID=29730 RepID=UPI00227BCBD0|nr:uncharacterized protein LOC105767319 [Gossypium raimondii]
MVSRLTSLEELHVVPKINLNLLELKSLSRLTALSLRLSTNQIPLEDFVLPKLQRYSIVVGENYRFNREAFRRLDIQDFSSSLSAFNNLFCNVEELNLRNVGGQKNIVPSIDEMGVNELTSLQLKSCNDMEFLIDTKNDQGSTVAFSNLVELNIESMVSLKGLCYGVSPTRFLQNLKQLIIKDCEELEVIFQIDKLSEKMKRQTPLLSNLTILSLHSLPKLKRIWEVKPSHRAIASLQSLKVVSIESCDNLKTIFSPCLALSMLHLQELDIRYIDRLEQVIGFGEEDEIIENDSPLCCWPKLRILRIEVCPNLKYVCANTWTQGLQSLESVYIRGCSQLIQVFNMEQNKHGQDIVLPELGSQDLVLSNVGNSRQLCNIYVPVLNEGYIVVGNHEEVFQVQGGYSFSSIRSFLLANLFEVRVIWNDFAQVVTLENLTTLTLKDCKKLRYIFSPMMARILSHLKDLFIEECEEIERLILAKDQVSSSSSNCDTSLQPMSFPNLTRITVTNCKNLNSLFPFGFVPVLPKLETLIVIRNSKLEQVFELEDEVEVVPAKEMKFDKLNFLLLEELPGLIHFCPKGYHSVFPAMIRLQVRDCPKLTTGFFIDSQEFVHFKTKNSQSHSRYSWDGKMLRRKGKVVVGNDPNLRKESFDYFHSGPTRGHSGVHAMRHRLSRLVYWKGLSKDVKMWIRECSICQKCKADLFASPRLLQPLPIPYRASEAISMDFVEGLPKSQGKNVILVVVDRLTKYCHFLAFVHPFTALTVAQDYMRHIYKQHGAPKSIISDCDKIFVNTFWQ